MKPARLNLEQGVEQAGLSFHEVWLRQLGVGGTASELEVEAYVLGLLSPDSYQHDLIAQAINERFLEVGSDHPVGYRSTALTD